MFPTIMERNQLIIVAVIAIIIAAAGGYWIGRSSQTAITPRSEQGSTPSNSENGNPSSSTFTGGNSVTVHDQAPGSLVKIDAVTLAEGGWVAIHEESDGKPGRIPGATRFNAGEGQTGSVELLWSTEEGKVYYAMLHRDDGDHKFDRTKDLPITDVEGNPIMTRFVAAVNPAQ